MSDLEKVDMWTTRLAIAGTCTGFFVVFYSTFGWSEAIASAIVGVPIGWAVGKIITYITE
jgi:hypothetical protein